MPRRYWFWISGGVALASLAVLLAVMFRSDGGGDTLVEFDPADLALGSQVYAQNCAVCHGASGAGQPNWKERGEDGRLPPPPHDVTGHTWHHADGLLYRLIRDGGGEFAGPTTPTGMPPFGERLTDEEIRAVIVHLKSLWGPDERMFQEQVSAADPLP